MRGGETHACHCYHHVNPVWLCLSVLPLGCAMVGNPSPGGHGLLLGSQLSCPPPDALAPPDFFIHLQNSPKSEWLLLSVCLRRSVEVMNNAEKWHFHAHKEIVWSIYCLSLKVELFLLHSISFVPILFPLCVIRWMPLQLQNNTEQLFSTFLTWWLNDLLWLPSSIIYIFVMITKDRLFSTVLC